MAMALRTQAERSSSWAAWSHWLSADMVDARIVRRDHFAGEVLLQALDRRKSHCHWSG